MADKYAGTVSYAGTTSELSAGDFAPCGIVLPASVGHFDVGEDPDEADGLFLGVAPEAKMPIATADQDGRGSRAGLRETLRWSCARKLNGR